MFITPSFKKSLIVEQFQGNYLKKTQRIDYKQEKKYSATSVLMITTHDKCEPISDKKINNQWLHDVSDSNAMLFF